MIQKTSVYRPILIIVLSCVYLLGNSQEKIYNINLKQDAAYIGVGLTLSVLGEVLVRNTSPLTSLEIGMLSKDDINSFDRWAASRNSESAQLVSDVILFSSITFPLLSYLSPQCKNNEIDIAVMGVETFLINYGITNIIKGSVERIRPLAYNDAFPLDSKFGIGTKHSFISGHTSNTAAMTFFIGRVFSDLYPDMKHKELIWIPVATIPASIGYLRVLAGKHFPSDVISGYIVGALVGYMIPTLHKRDDLNIGISIDGGFSLNYKF